MVSRSRTTRNRASCWFPPLGAFTAASRMSSMSASGTAWGLNRRMDRWGKVASPGDEVAETHGRGVAERGAVGGDVRSAYVQVQVLVQVVEDVLGARVSWF